MEQIKEQCKRLVAVVGVAFVALGVMAGNALAAADPLTGIDAKADIADPALASAKPFLLAGVGIMAVIAAVGLGRKLWGKVGGAR